MLRTVTITFQRINFILSLALLLSAPLASLAMPNAHMLLAISFLELFPFFIALAYLESVERVKLTYLSPLGLLVLLGPRYLAIALTLAGLISLYHVRKVKLESLRFSALLVSLSMLLGGLYTVLFFSLNVDFALKFALLYDVLMIYGVSTHSFPNTFRDKPDWPLTFLAVVFLILSLVYDGFMLISLILYFLGAKFYKAWKFYEIVKNYSGIAKKGNLYLLVGTLSSVTGILSALPLNTLYKLHYLLMGFVAPHIFTHLPLMIPAILRVRAFKDYCLVTFILLILAVLSWPSLVSMILFLGSVVCIIKSYLM